jgi:hypothetical protein
VLLLQGHQQCCSTSRPYNPATATAAQYAHLVRGVGQQLTLLQLARQESLLQQLQRQLLAVLMQQLLRTLVQQQQQVWSLTVTGMMATRVTLKMMTQRLSRPAARGTVKMNLRSGSSASCSSSSRRPHFRLQLEQQQQLAAGSQACAASSSEGLLLLNNALQQQQQQLPLGGLASQLVCQFSSRCQRASGRLLQCSSCCLLPACQAGRAWAF